MKSEGFSDPPKKSEGSSEISMMSQEVVSNSCFSRSTQELIVTSPSPLFTSMATTLLGV
jgi:hypothetical protein